MKLYDVNFAIPAPAREKLRDVAFWMEANNPRVPGDCYHPSRAWLEKNGYNPEKEKRAYALNNDQEYFAETSEAYFAVNDFFPFVRGERLAHDPETARLLGTLWGKPDGPSAKTIDTVFAPA